MFTWVYRCEKCSFAFALNIEEGVTIPESVKCPQCEGAEALKQFEMPASMGGCGCSCGDSGRC